MLGRNAARPLVGVSPSRLVAAYSAMASSHRLAHWMLSKPYTMLHMHRFLFLAPQLLLTHATANSNIGGINVSSNNGHATTLVSLDGSSSSSCQIHTTPSPLAQPQLTMAVPAHEILLPADLYTPYLHGTATTSEVAASTAAATAEATDAATTTTAQSIVKPMSISDAITFNYLLAASWHPKSRQRQQQLLLQQQQQLEQQQQDIEDAAKAERTLRWKQKLRAAHPVQAQAQAHPGRVDAGEDAFFHVSTPSRVALGVADGVGGWSEMGVDPALFSWALMNNAENIARLTDSVPSPSLNDNTDINPTMNSSPDADASALIAGGERKVLDAQSILDGAYSELVQSGTIEAGSSTACILSLCKRTGTLKASNLGDSAFLLIRDNKCIYESPSQQHFWNCPYQLTVLPPKLRQQPQPQPVSGDISSPSNSSMSGDSDETNKKTTASTTTTTTTTAARKTTKVKKAKYVQDLPKDAVQTTHQLQDGDVIVLATDGFWDNVFTKEAIELVDTELGDLIREEQRLRQIRQQLRSRTDITMSIEQMVPETMTADEILARVRALSKRLTNTARRFSLDSKRMTPFSQGARHIQCGGKVDDITVIVTLVRSTMNL